MYKAILTENVLKNLSPFVLGMVVGNLRHNMKHEFDSYSVLMRINDFADRTYNESENESFLAGQNQEW